MRLLGQLGRCEHQVEAPKCYLARSLPLLSLQYGSSLTGLFTHLNILLSKLRIASSENTTGVAPIRVSTNNSSVEYSETTFKWSKYPCSISKNHRNKTETDRPTECVCLCSCRHLLLHRPLCKQPTVPADMYPAIRSFILSPNKHRSNIFTSIFRAIKPQGLTNICKQL
jgi:hypothetical protein